MRRPPNAGYSVRDLTFTVQQLVDGRNNAAGTVTLTPSATETVITGDTINENAAFLCFPQTATAASEFAAGTMYATVTKGQVTITHGSSAATDRTFRYTITGG